MSDYSKFAKAASKRRKALVKELAHARSAVAACESEMDILDQVLAALGGAGGRRGRGAAAGPRKRGKWRPGRPGRPPKWWVEQQKAKGGKKKRRGRKRGRKAKAAAPAATPAA